MDNVKVVAELYMPEKIRKELAKAKATKTEKPAPKRATRTREKADK